MEVRVKMLEVDGAFSELPKFAVTWATRRVGVERAVKFQNEVACWTWIADLFDMK